MTFRANAKTREDERIVGSSICPSKLTELSDVRCFARTRETSIQERITGKRHYPVERNATNNSTICFCRARARNAAAFQGILEARNCRVAITTNSHVNRANFYSVTCWRAITVVLNSDIVQCSCSNNEFRCCPLTKSTMRSLSIKTNMI